MPWPFVSSANILRMGDKWSVSLILVDRKSRDFWTGDKTSQVLVAAKCNIKFSIHSGNSNRKSNEAMTHLLKLHMLTPKCCDGQSRWFRES